MDVPVLMVPLLAKVIVIDFTAAGLRFRMDQQETNKHKNRNLITVKFKCLLHRICRKKEEEKRAYLGNSPVVFCDSK